MVPVWSTKNFNEDMSASQAYTALDVMPTLMSRVAMTFSLYAVALEYVVAWSRIGQLSDDNSIGQRTMQNGHCFFSLTYHSNTHGSPPPVLEPSCSTASSPLRTPAGDQCQSTTTLMSSSGRFPSALDRGAVSQADDAAEGSCAGISQEILHHRPTRNT